MSELQEEGWTESDDQESRRWEREDDDREREQDETDRKREHGE